jgi:hypothetical protein
MLPPRLRSVEPNVGRFAKTRSSDRGFGFGVRAEDIKS